MTGFDSGENGGVSNIQLGTGFNNTQQNAAAMVFAAGASAKPRL